MPLVNTAHGEILPTAFAPSKADVTGLSLTRAKYHSYQFAANRRIATTDTYVVSLLAQQLIDRGLSIKPSPLLADLNKGLPACPGHCEIPEIRYDNKDNTLELQAKLLDIVIDKWGPLPKVPLPV